ncbi:MAG: efflux RND transporter periplasmic adaptor subunit [Gammaproteobacteria bacterium]|nr:efflux RND transporter periplasmic adaptor subunit [Gammaproteobacteria bacterium]
MKKSTALIVLLTAASALLLTGCNDKKESKQIVRPVKTMTVAQPQTTTTRTFPAKVSADKEVKLAFKVPGQLIELPIFEGDKIEQNQLIAALDPKKYQETVNEAKAEYIRAKADYNRARQIVDKGYITRSEFDKKKAEFLRAEANYHTAQHDLNDSKLHAPFSGIIAKKYVDNFQYVATKQPIVNLQDVNHVNITIHVPENIIANIPVENRKQHASAKVIFSSLPQKAFPLSIKEYSTEADPETQTFKIVFIMPKPPELNILPGMTATVTAQIPDYKSGASSFFTIPSSAVFVDDDNNSFIWLVDPKSMHVKRQQVKVTKLADKEIHVTSGITPGNIIVTAGVHFLQDNEKVKFLQKIKTEY